MRNIIVGLLFFVGGASGRLALVGTNSSGALMAVGVGLALWGGYQVFSQQDPDE